MSTSKFGRHRQLEQKHHITRGELYETHRDEPVCLEYAAKDDSAKGMWAKYMGKYVGRQKIFAYVMLILVLVESVFLFLQAAKGFTTKSAEDIDLAAFIILLVVNVAWTIYAALVVHDLPLMLSGITYTLGAVLVIVTVILYGDQ